MELFHKALSPLALLMLCAATASAASPDLAKRVAQQDGWVAYPVPMTAEAGMACCFEFHGKQYQPHARFRDRSGQRNARLVAEYSGAPKHAEMTQASHPSRPEA